MKIEVQVGVTIHHLLAILIRIARIQDTQRVGKHETLDGKLLEVIHHEEDVIRGVLDAIRPILQIDIHINLAPSSLVDHCRDVIQMLLWGLTQLFGHMLERAFAEQVHHPATGGLDPIQRDGAIHEAQHL